MHGSEHHKRIYSLLFMIMKCTVHMLQAIRHEGRTIELRCNAWQCSSYLLLSGSQACNHDADAPGCAFDLYFPMLQLQILQQACKKQ